MTEQQRLTPEEKKLLRKIEVSTSKDLAKPQH